MHSTHNSRNNRRVGYGRAASPWNRPERPSDDLLPSVGGTWWLVYPKSIYLMGLIRANPVVSNEWLRELKIAQHDLVPYLQQSGSPQPQKWSVTQFFGPFAQVWLPSPTQEFQFTLPLQIPRPGSPLFCVSLSVFISFREPRQTAKMS